MNKNRKNRFSVILMLIGVLCIGVALFGLVPILWDYYEAEKNYEQLENHYVTLHERTTVELAQAKVWYELASVDVQTLQMDYPNVVGWIMFENEDISYPIMQATDNDYYLDRAYDGKKSSSGSIFLDAYSTSDFTDFHTIIYGHNMKNLSMFGRLKYYKTKSDYYNTHRYFQIFKKDEILRYEIFAYQESSIKSNFFDLQNNIHPSDILSELTSNSMVSSEIDVNTDDKVITLSTCTSNEDYRFTISAVLVDRHALKDKE